LAKYINDPRNQFPIIIVITLSIYMNYFFLNNEIEGRYDELANKHDSTKLKTKKTKNINMEK
jgi:hypothetical protein